MGLRYPLKRQRREEVTGLSDTCRRLTVGASEIIVSGNTWLANPKVKILSRCKHKLMKKT